MSRLCEEFHCRPSEALEEWRVAPVGFLEEIVEARAFAAAKQAVDDAHARSQEAPDTPMAALVIAIEMDEAQAEIRGRSTHD